MYSQNVEIILSNVHSVDVNRDQEMSDYSRSFNDEGARKVQYIVNKLGSHPRLSGDMLRRFIAVSIGGADGSDLLEVARRTSVRHCILVEYDNNSAEIARTKTQSLLSSIGCRLDIIVGDANQQRELIVAKLEGAKDHGIAGLILMFHGILHELPSRSPGFELTAYLSRLTSVYPNNLLFISEPCSTSGLEQYDFRIRNVHQDRLNELAGYINAHLFYNRHQPIALSHGYVRAPLPLILETLHKLLRFNDVPRFKYEMQERLTQYTPDDLRASVDMALPRARIKEERFISEGFDQALRNSGVELRTLDNKNFSLKYSHVRFEVESLHESFAALVVNPENDECPYQGLSAFDEHTREYFFGKDVEIKRITDKLSRNNFAIVIGASGSGKSSVVKAGVVHLLKPSISTFHVFHPGTNPLAKLIACAEDIARKEGLGINAIKQICTNLCEQGGGADLLNAISRDSKHLIVIDQFEELFTLCSQPDERKLFLAHIIDIARTSDNRLSIVATLRADHMQSFLPNREIAELLQHHSVYMLPMNLVELQRAIIEPAKLKNYSFQDGLVELILEDLGNERTSLPLLQFTLTELWKTRNTLTKQLTLTAYRSIGRVSGCLNNYAEDIYNKVRESDREVMKRIFLRLVRPFDDNYDSKQRRPKESFLDLSLSPETTSEGQVEDLLQELLAKRLLILDVESDDEWIDMIHESLMDGWQRLANWRKEDRPLMRLRGKIEVMHNEWLAKNQQDDYLLHGGLLREVISSFHNLRTLTDSKTLKYCQKSFDLFDIEKNRIYRSLSLNMALLVENAKFRLTLANPRDYGNEAFIELYSKAAEIKNVDEFDPGEILQVNRADLICDEPVMTSSTIWSCSLSVRYEDLILPWGRVFVNSKTKRSELLLDNRPQAWTGSPFTHKGFSISKLRLVDSSFTKEAITMMERRYSEFYGGEAEVLSFGGFLKDANRRQFQKEYAFLKESSPSLSDAELYQQAILETSFGKARFDLGINVFDILTIGDDIEVRVEGIGSRRVPDTIIVVDAFRQSRSSAS
jgi:Cdc6-like AAA superfamily ATPase